MYAKIKEHLKVVVIKVKAQCPECSGSGVYKKPGTENEKWGVVCLHCKGKGFFTLEYTPFDGREIRSDVEGVYHISEKHAKLGGNPVPYRKFVEGKMPS